MSVKVSARINDNLYDFVMQQDGKNFTEKLESLLSDRNKKVSDNAEIDLSNNDKFTLNFDQAKFLIGFLHLYEGNFAKWWTKNEDIDNTIIYFIRNILLELGDISFPSSNLPFVSLQDVKSLIKPEYTYLNFK
ncbi:MAG: hypothetical protein Q8900_12345 [Bacillota bacterium]|nr:hypothetical protein [Bacillota bacterium]